MIATLRGRILKKYANGLVVDTGGVGYEVTVPVRDLSRLPEEGSEVFLYIHTLMREDGIYLYGFLDDESRRLFRKLIGVSGVGPRLAMNILSGMEPEQFYRTLEQEDLTMLTSLPGVGKKTAQRLLFEMKQVIPDSVQRQVSQQYEDLLYALQGLGYTKNQAQEALKKVYSDDKPMEDLLREALQILSPVREKLK